MKQTAVEWLYERLERMIPRSALYDIDKREYFKQAKEMEKKQVIDAYKKAHEDGYHFEGSVSDYESEGLEKHLAEQYYNETFNK
jgi:hypothetical protein